MMKGHEVPDQESLLHKHFLHFWLDIRIVEVLSSCCVKWESVKSRETACVPESVKSSETACVVENFRLRAYNSIILLKSINTTASPD